MLDRLTIVVHITRHTRTFNNVSVHIHTAPVTSHLDPGRKRNHALILGTPLQYGYVVITVRGVHEIISSLHRITATTRTRGGHLVSDQRACITVCNWDQNLESI